MEHALEQRQIHQSPQSNLRQSVSRCRLECYALRDSFSTPPTFAFLLLGAVVARIGQQAVLLTPADQTVILPNDPYNILWPPSSQPPFLHSVVCTGLLSSHHTFEYVFSLHRTHSCPLHFFPLPDRRGGNRTNAIRDQNQQCCFWSLEQLTVH